MRGVNCKIAFPARPFFVRRKSIKLRTANKHPMTTTNTATTVLIPEKSDRSIACNRPKNTVPSRKYRIILPRMNPNPAFSTFCLSAISSENSRRTSDIEHGDSPPISPDRATQNKLAAERDSSASSAKSWSL